MMGEGCVCRMIARWPIHLHAENSDGCSSDNLVHVSAIEESRSLRAMVTLLTSDGHGVHERKITVSAIEG